MKTKVCTKCGKRKKVEEFVAGKKLCKLCWSAYMRNYYKTHSEHRELVKLQGKVWRRDNPEAKAAMDRAWRVDNKEKLAAYNKAYHVANADKATARASAWVEDNPERARATKLAWYRKNKARLDAVADAWRKDNPERVREKYKARLSADPYITRMLCEGTALVPADIPQELIDAKREHLKLKRQLKGV